MQKNTNDTLTPLITKATGGDIVKNPKPTIKCSGHFLEK